MSLIECDNITKRYGSTLALDGVTLSLEAGAPIALIGPNGAGKTTLFSLLCGFLRASSGDVKIMGYSASDSRLHGRLAALPQDANLDPRFTVGHQLTMLARLQGMSSGVAHKEVLRVLDKVGLPEVIVKKPEALSHGMRKRVMLAQALMGSPELILLDEPTAGLDPPNVKVMRSLIAEAANNATFIISSHNLDELERVCKSVVHLEQGKLKGVVDIAQSRSSGYYTVVMAEMPVAANIIIASLKSLPSVNNVTFNEPNRFVIEYDAAQAGLDLTIMQCLSDKGWPYRQLVNGRTLEDQLYFGSE
ncbi:ABC transporter ATP-binding protein [Leucothrix arctica]|uniref:ABC transporter ATP-binding protein n=1 Tax=Leucothrix arctica TaxID=1481894 RepID=A0A317CIZ3_9GAMM|nr:ABC transporter ATP-binding protein [Leucothrix arctica]PWQ98299.1 ABC transporter ATP-binding protein [Leucothrix arctica]